MNAFLWISRECDHSSQNVLCVNAFPQNQKFSLRLMFEFLSLKWKISLFFVIFADCHTYTNTHTRCCIFFSIILRLRFGPFMFDAYFVCVCETYAVVVERMCTMRSYVLTKYSYIYSHTPELKWTARWSNQFFSHVCMTFTLYKAREFVALNSMSVITFITFYWLRFNRNNVNE